MGDVLSVDLAQEADRLVEPAELGVVVLDVTGGEVAHALHLDVVDHRGEDLLARAVLIADRDPDDLAALVLARLVAQPDRGRLSSPFELVDEGGREEVERERAARHGESQPNGIPDGPAIRDSPRCRSGARNGRGRSPSARARRRCSGPTSPSSRRNTVSMSAASVAIGITRRPPGASCSIRVGGGEGAVAWTAIASYGARSGRPALPSPTTTSTLLMPISASSSRAAVGQLLHPLDRDHLGGQHAPARRPSSRSPSRSPAPAPSPAAPAPRRSRPRSRAERSSGRGRSAARSPHRRAAGSAPARTARAGPSPSPPARARRESRAGEAATRPSRRAGRRTRPRWGPPHQKM